jgi:hypothetical protein
MLKNLALISVLLAATLSLALKSPPSINERMNVKNVTVHEWGTFTSIAGEDGRPVEWLPAGGPTDLPCFVNRFETLGLKLSLSGTVRMETPVLYFYSPAETTVSVKVHFPEGLITEWYPQATVRSGAIDWISVKISPSAPADFPSESGPSRYYAARQTDAAPLQVGSQRERFLFYRGVGHFSVPISAQLNDAGNIVVRNSTADSVGSVIIFENRNGKSGYRIQKAFRGPVTIERPSLDSKVPSLLADLERMLVVNGLYPKEARAMVETWRDSWFEEGTRLFYIVPAHALDAILPLEIDPRPAQVVRVFVGRMEVVSPSIGNEIREAIARSDQFALAKYGRFLQPIMDRILAGSTPAERARAQHLLQSVYARYASSASRCAH